MNQRTTAPSFFFSLLGLLFIGLKLTNYIAWSWWWVLAPFWGPLVFAIALFLVVLLFVAVREAIKHAPPSFNGNTGALIAAGLALAIMAVTVVQCSGQS